MSTAEELYVQAGLGTVEEITTQGGSLTEDQHRALTALLASRLISTPPTVDNHAFEALLQRVDTLSAQNEALQQRLAPPSSFNASPTNSNSQAPTIDWNAGIEFFKHLNDSQQPREHSSRIKVKEPEAFDGTRNGKTDINTFVSQVRNYVTDTTGWKDDAHRVRVVSSYLRGSAYLWISSYLSLPDTAQTKAEYRWLFDFNLFLSKLLTTFGNPDKEEADARRLDRLKQTGSASLYAAEFRRLSLTLGWNDKALRFRFVAGLKEELKDELARMDPITDFDQLVEKVVIIDNRTFQRRLQKTGRSAPSYNPFTPMPVTPAASTPPEDRMQVDSARKTTPGAPKAPLTAAEKEYRRVNKLCAYCGQPGHYQDTCPAIKQRDALHSFQPRLSVRADPKNPRDDQHLVLPVQLRLSTDQEVSAHAMVDSGSQGNLMDESYARSLRIPLLPRENPVPVEAFDGRPADSALVYHTAPVQLQIGPHYEQIEFNVAKVAHYPIMLGTPWLRAHDVSLDFANNTAVFRSPFCAQHCLPPAASSPRPVPARPRCPDLAEPVAIRQRAAEALGPVRIISAAAARLALRHGAQAFLLSAAGLVPRLRAAAAHLATNAGPPEPEEIAKLRTQVPERYHEWLDVFSKDSADTLPPHRPYDLEIHIEEGKSVPPAKLYSLSAAELQVLADYIEENLQKKFIRPSTSPLGANVLFIKKKDGTLRLCVDYRALNAVTKKNRYPLPLINETLDQLAGATHFTKIDLRNGYHQLRIAEGHEEKTAFKTRYGSFEYLVMPFGLTNAPAAFQHLINDTFRPFLDVFVVVYLDDILVYSRNAEEHDRHVKLVLDKMREAKLFAKIEKCSFGASSCEYLGFIVDQDGVRMDPSKIEAVRSWPVPSTLREVQSFLGFANFYRRFIQNYSRIAHPLTRLTQKKTHFTMDDEAVRAFNTLREAFDGEKVLRHFRPGLPVELETDASDFALGSVLSQRHEDGRLYPVAFRSRKFDAAELNYEVHDKELLAIVDACRTFRPYLEYVDRPTLIFSDHANLQYFFTSRVLNRRQARWYELMAELSLTLRHRPGHRQGKTDALSRRADYAEGAKAADGKPVLFFAPTRIGAATLNREIDDPFPTLAERVAVGQDQDDDIRQILQDLRLQENLDDLDSRWTLDAQGLLRWQGKVYIPDVANLRLRAVQNAHDNPSAGHPGVERTLERLRRNAYFPQERRFVENYVSSCDHCFRNKSRRTAPHGFLQPLPAPERPWSSIALDFVVKLPTTPDGYDSILVVVDRFTKYAHFIPCTEAGTDASRFAQLFYDNIFAQHGLPDDIVSDRGAVFDSSFWRTLSRLTRTKLSMSTAYHPQSDGVTERLNQTLEQYLRMFVNYQQDDWRALLPLAQFCYNDSFHSAIKTTPFHAAYGFHPRFDVSFQPADDRFRDADATAFASRLATQNQVLRYELDLAAQRMKKQADKHRREAPRFDIGDLVWLNRKNIETTRQSRKLDSKFLGPYKIAAKVGESAYRLELPDEVRLHPVFHVSLLHPHRDNPFPDRIPQPPPLTIVDGQPELEVDTILDSRTYYGKLQYLVRWRGFAPTHDSWESADNLANAAELVENFHRLYPKKPRGDAERRGRRSKAGEGMRAVLARGDA
ncbi:hypothetical protein JCM10207_006080 [Rhodosporidiobolus poonsookiae]